MAFDISRHNDPMYEPPEPWTKFDIGNDFDATYCWVCKYCWAAAGFQIHNPYCKWSKSDDQK